MNRFHRTILLLGKKAFQTLADAHVTVVGIGAVGSFAVEGLARAGVGHIHLVDCDEIRETNVNRQLHALESTIGQMKVDITAQRVRDINPNCDITTENMFVDQETVETIFQRRMDVMIDAIDSVGPKVTLLETAIQQEVPCIISSMGAATRLDPESIHIKDISKTRYCPLARIVRKRLRRRGIKKGIRCVYSTELPMELKHDEAPELVEPRLHDRGRKRAPLGSLGCLTGIFGLLAAREAIMYLIENGASQHI